MRKILISLGCLLLTVGFLVGGTGSYLKSQATSNNNVISTGTVEVVLSDENETEKVALSNSWGHLESSAGEVIAESEIKIINKGTLNSNHLEIQFNVQGDMELAKHIFFNDNTGLLLGRQRTTSESLTTYLLGNQGQSYKVMYSNGTLITTLDGNDGTPQDNRISLSELHSAGVIRIRPFNEGFPMQAGSTASLWVNAYIDPNLTKGGQSVNTTLTFSLEQ